MVGSAAEEKVGLVVEGKVATAEEEEKAVSVEGIDMAVTGQVAVEVILAAVGQAALDLAREVDSRRRAIRLLCKMVAKGGWDGMCITTWISGFASAWRRCSSAQICQALTGRDTQAGEPRRHILDGMPCRSIS